MKSLGGQGWPTFLRRRCLPVSLTAWWYDAGGLSRLFACCDGGTLLIILIPMKLGIILSQTEPETVFNALRLANYSLKQGDTVRIFLMGQGVELDRIEDPKFNVREQAQAVLAAGGQFLACGTCLELRSSSGSEICPLSTLKDLYELVRDSDRLVTL
jgi:uncharacterized protein involved in oxidation of intracellular sulfur